MPQTLEEICAAHPREWVLIVDCEEDQVGRLVAGTVLAHSPHRRDIYLKQVDCGHDQCAIQYTGPFPDDQQYLL